MIIEQNDLNITKMQTPIDKKLVDDAISDLGIQDFEKATIREVKSVAAYAD